MDDLRTEEPFDPFDMDREEFNPTLCMIRYTEECSLQNLIARGLHIDKDICNLESDLQNMLYDNYRKFINAASIVSNMKTDFQKMEKEMNLLHLNLKDVELTSSTILGNLRPSEDKVLELVKRRDAMKRLLVLTDLVPKIQMYIDSGRYVAAAKYYLKARNLLEKYRTLPSISGIVKDCVKMMESVKMDLRSKLNYEIYGKEEISETLTLILALGESPESLLKYFITCCHKNIQSLLNVINSFWENVQNENIESGCLNKVLVNYFNSTSSYMESISKTIVIVRNIFIFGNAINTSMFAKGHLEEFVTISTNILSVKIRDHLKTIFDNIDDDFLSHILDKFNRQCYSLGVIAPDFNLYQKSMNIILKVCADRCEFHLQKLKLYFNNNLASLKNDLLSNSHLENVDLIEVTEDSLNQTLKLLICYIRPEFKCCREISFRKLFCKVLVREGIFVEFFRYIYKETWHEISSLNAKESTMIFMSVIFAKYLLNLHQFVPQFMSKVDDCLCSTTDNLSLSSITDISQESKTIAQKIIERYVSIRLQIMTHMIRKSIENKNWMKSNEPTRPRALVKVLFTEIQNTKIEAEKFFGMCQSPVRRRKNDLETVMSFKTCSLDRSPDRSSFEERVLLNKLFTKSLKVFGKVELQSYSIVSCLIRMTLKSFLEHIRLCTFNNFSFQQIQVDVFYLESRISQILVCTSDIHSLFDDIVSSAYNRTYKPEFMNLHVVSTICNNTG